FVVTGATSGIGRATTEQLARHGARVIMACRDRDLCVKERRDIVLGTGNKQIYCRQVDLSSYESIRNFVAKLTSGQFFPVISG
uniref:Uncharacterized protein n=1 Tax=Plectus sambesii TaxID=2011161 RepID=A0A914VFA0_9BILA